MNVVDGNQPEAGGGRASMGSVSCGTWVKYWPFPYSWYSTVRSTFTVTP